MKKHGLFIRVFALILILTVPGIPACLQTPQETEAAATVAVTDTVTAEPVETETETEAPAVNGSLKIKPVGDTVYTYTDSVRAYLEAGADAVVSDYTDGSDDQHKDLVIEWEYNGEEKVLSYVFECSKNEDLSGSVSVSLTGITTKRKLTNLNKATKYYVRITALTENASVSDTVSFSTSSLGPRVLNVGGHYGNVRDLGGYVTEDGHTVLQDMVFRGSALDDCVNADKITLTAAGKKYFNDEVGVKTELDLRGTSENCSRTTSALQSAENYLQVPVINFHGAFYKDQASLYAKVFRAFADKNNYPIYFHCSAGADRTGTVAAILLSLLGVKREEIIQDFELTSFSKVGERSKAKLMPVLDNLDRFNGDTVSEKTENYLLSIGLSKQEIYGIKAIMLGLDPDGFVEKPAYELKDREFEYGTAKGGDLKLTLLEEYDVSAVKINDKDVSYVQDGKNITIPEADVKAIGKGSFAGTVTFEDGNHLNFRIMIDEADITEGLSVTHSVAGPSGTYYTYVFMSYPYGIFDGIEYHFHSRQNEFPDVEANILINGVSIKELNQQDMSRYTFSEFPGSSVDRHKVPITILCQDNTVSLLIHTGWLSEYLKGKEMQITITKDFSFTNNGVRYYVCKDKTFLRSKTSFKEIK